jgi:hypothetical protein
VGAGKPGVTDPIPADDVGACVGGMTCCVPVIEVVAVVIKVVVAVVSATCSSPGNNPAIEKTKIHAAILKTSNIATSSRVSPWRDTVFVED